MAYPEDEETFDVKNVLDWIRKGHLNSVGSLLKRIQDFLGYGGRLHDKTGLVMPVGAEMGYTGETAPEGWLLEDGEHYNGTTSTYIDLWNVIGLKYGGTAQGHFAVPDRRGFFVRGWTNIPVKSFVPAAVNIGQDTIEIEEGLYNRKGFPVRFSTDDTLPPPFVINTTYYLVQAHGYELEFATTWQNAIDGVKINITGIGAGTSYLHPYNEEDAGSRIISAKGGASGADLGSYQEDEIINHRHLVPTRGALEGGGAVKFPLASPDVGSRYTEYEGGNETRPRNVYTNYIIKR